MMGDGGGGGFDLSAGRASGRAHPGRGEGARAVRQPQGFEDVRALCQGGGQHPGVRVPGAVRADRRDLRPSLIHI